jgi:methyl-accepting chemotaxis protein
MTLRVKLWLLAVTAFIGVLLIIGYSLMSLNAKMVEEKKLKTKSIVEATYGIIEHFHKLSVDGKMSEKEAKAAVIAIINGLRYEKKEYFFLSDLEPILLVHPLRPGSVGKNASDIKDSDGNSIFVQFAAIAKKQGEGFMNYSQKLPDKPPLPKISFVKYFAPWQWVLASGIYIEDVNTAFWGMAWRMVLIGTLVMVFIFGLGFFINNSILRQLGAEPAYVAEVVKSVARGDLSVSVETKAGDNKSLLADMKEMILRLREIVENIKVASDGVTSGSNGLSGHSAEISLSMTGQAERASQIATSAEEMSQTVVDIAKNASNMASSAISSSEMAKEGEKIVSRSVSEVRAIATTVSESARIMKDLGTRSKQIGEIVSVINDIADQTNLLALNAAIEAARAGEQGRGFAVVADEVRKLAERTAKATSEIGSMIKGIQEDVDGAVVSMDGATKQVDVGVEFSSKAGESLHKIVRSVDELHTLVQQIATATEEMSSVSGHISSDIQSIASASHDIKAGSGQISQASTDLASVATNLKGVVSRFQM